MDEGLNDSRTSVFEHHRGLLFSIAYRMLGSVADAEDALQDAFIRWQRASETDVRSPKAFLVTIVSRLCINHLQSARVQREMYVGEWLPEPLVTEPGSDASQVAQVDESVSMAVLLLLERLTPVERAVFLLGEIFDYTHAEIAGILSISEANCRQLLRRARQHVRMERPRFSTSGRQHTDLLERFYRAAGSGDMDGLLALLSSDVVMHTDGGGKASALPLPIYGPDKVARASVFGLTKLKTLNPLQRIVQLNGEPGIVSYVEGRPQSVFTIDVNDGRIRAIYIVTNPEKLSHLPPRLSKARRLPPVNDLLADLTGNQEILPESKLG
jgi:RNA polymerase sigma-70 factor, ECF subfamily